MKSKLYLKSFMLLIVCTLSYSSVFSALQSEERISRSEYIDTWKSTAIQNMVEHKIPASITLAQGILESGDGNSQLAKKSNNHFGIKCHDWKGKKVYHDDDKKGECFRKYDDASDSFEDHSNFLMRKRYASLFELDIKDYKGWAKGLKKCGYATDPSYAKRLIQLIEKNNLQLFDDYALNQTNVIVQNKDDKKKEDKNKEENKTIAKEKDHNSIPATIEISNSRVVSVSSNRIKYVLAKEGDTPESIAVSLDLPKWIIRKYNDLKSEAVIEPGELVYIQPKRKKADTQNHVFKSGESMRLISQQYGIKLRSLYKLNKLERGSQPSEGTILSLNKKAG